MEQAQLTEVLIRDAVVDTSTNLELETAGFVFLEVETVGLVIAIGEERLVIGGRIDDLFAALSQTDDDVVNEDTSTGVCLASFRNTYAYTWAGLVVPLVPNESPYR